MDVTLDDPKPVVTHVQRPTVKHVEQLHARVASLTASWD
jgi:hypothetical protein